MSNATAVTRRSPSVTLMPAALFVCWLSGNEEKCKNQSMCFTTKKVQDLAGSPCWPFLKNEGKSKLIIILKACPGDAFCCDTSIYQSSEDSPHFPPPSPPPPINISRDQSEALSSNIERVSDIYLYLFIFPALQWQTI